MNPFRYILRNKNEISEKITGEWSYIKCGLIEVQFNGNFFYEGNEVEANQNHLVSSLSCATLQASQGRIKEAITTVMKAIKNKPITESDWLELTASEQEEFLSLLTTQSK